MLLAFDMNSFAVLSMRGSQDDTSASRRRSTSITTSCRTCLTTFTSGFFLVHGILRFDSDVQHICRSVRLQFALYFGQYNFTLMRVQRWDGSPLRLTLSASNWPKNMSRIAEGEEGFASQSATYSQHPHMNVYFIYCIPSLQSLSINSFKLYTLMTAGSKMPSLSLAATFLFVKYFSFS